MGFFWRRRKSEKDKNRVIKQIIAGLIIGGAIGSVVGKKILHKHEEEIGDEDDEDQKE